MASRGDAETRRRAAASVLFPVAFIALLAATPAIAQHRVVGRDAETAARLLRLEDRREYDSAFIASALASPSAEVRRRAVLAAGRIGDRHATSAVAARLADPDTAVAASAAFALGLLRDTSAVPALAAVARTSGIARRPTVVGEAALALGKMPSAAGKQAVEEFLAAAPARGAGVQRAVGEALLAVWRFPRPMNVSAVAKWLSSPDPELRWRAAYALSRRADPQATAALARVAGDRDPLVRSFAVRALAAPLVDSAGLPWREALRTVLSATGDADHAVSVNAVRTLGTYDAAESISRLVELLHGDGAYLSITAAESLGRLGGKAHDAAGALRAAAEDAARPVAVRTAALAALEEVAPALALEVADAFARESGWRYRAAAARVYANAAKRADYASSPVRPKLEAAVRDPDGRVATAALEAAVGAAGDSAARIRPLLEMGLQSPDFYARVNAIGGIGAIGDPADAPALLEAYARAQRDSMDDAALAAVDALGQLGRKDTGVARAFFARFGRPGDYLVRQHVATAFGEDVPAGLGSPLPIAAGKLMDEYRRLVSLPARPHVRIVTDRGTIELALFGDDAPITVDNFLALARRHFFDGQEWPRVVANFVIQGGDPRGDTNGGPGYAIRDEINRHPYGTGTLGMALSGPDTGGSQWFVTHSPQPHLDGTYTVFGQVVRGMDVTGRILPGDRIIRVEEVR